MAFELEPDDVAAYERRWNREGRRGERIITDEEEDYTRWYQLIEDHVTGNAPDFRIVNGNKVCNKCRRRPRQALPVAQKVRPLPPRQRPPHRHHRLPRVNRPRSAHGPGSWPKNSA